MCKKSAWLVTVALGLIAGMPPAGWCQPPPGGGDKPRQGQGQWQQNPAMQKLQRFVYQMPETRLAFNMKPNLGRAIGLTDDQINQFAQAYDAINPEGAEQAMRQKMQDPNVPQEEKQKLRAEREAQMKTATEQLRTKLQEIMTPEQKSLWQKIEAASKAAEKAFNDTLSQALTPEEKQRMEQPQGPPPPPAREQAPPKPPAG